MEMKGSQTHTAGFSFDADKLSEAEQSHRTKAKNQAENKKKKTLGEKASLFLLPKSIPRANNASSLLDVKIYFSLYISLYI